MADAVTHTRDLTCIGMRTLTGGKLGQGWIDDEGREYFWGKAIPGATVGAVYQWSFASEDGKRAFVNTNSEHGPRYLTCLSRTEDPRIPDWEAEHYAAKAKAAARSQAKKEQVSDLLTALQPYREAYRKLAFPDARAAYLATIIRAVTG
jgi:hypothetical protein